VTVADRDEVRALLVLQRLPGVGDLNLQKLLDAFGSARAAMTAQAKAFQEVVSGAAASERSDERLGRSVDEALDWCDASGVRVVHRGSADYPLALANITNPPAVLFLKGDVSLLGREIVTVVGSRKASEYGRRVAREVAATAARHGAVIASGLALGIDGEAHASALEVGGKTLAVLGAGLLRPYPRSHARLFHRIATEGLLVSEFLPPEPPMPYNFPRRNRTLAALAKVLVVVEAAEKSGALNTANHAIDLGKDILAVPGSIYAPNCRGTNALLENAYPLVSAATVLDFLTPAADQLPLAPTPPAGIGADALRVWDALTDAPRHVDEVARGAKLATSAVLSALAMLEVAGWVRHEAGARYTRSAGA
jgi:DNA processing protein